MKLLRYSRCAAAAALVLAAFGARAQDAGDGTLHVLRPVIHAEQESAELCLEFDHDLDTADHDRIAAALRLEAGGKSIAVKAQNVSVTGNLLCVPSLEHRREYRIVVNSARGSKGEKLSSPYGLSFSVPDRAPFLSFTGNVEGMAHWRDGNPVLRVVNVPYVRLELYRIADPDMMSAAWRDRQQTVLAPSESATFGHDHGKLVWSGDLALDGQPNKFFEHDVPLLESVPNTPNGLYLIVARGPDVKPEAKLESETDAENEAKPAPFAPLAASWLVRSDLRLHVLRDTAGLYGLAAKPGAPAEGLGNMRLVAEDANAANLAETRSGADGVGFIALSADKLGAATTLAAFGDAGDVDFADVNAGAVTRFAPPKDEITLAVGKSFYPPGAEASVAFAAHDAQHKPLAENGTMLALLGMDGAVYMDMSAPPLANGIAHLEFPAPAQEGVWTLSWRQGDHELAQAVLRVTADPMAPSLKISADQPSISREGQIGLTLTSLAANSAPAPYIAGQVFVAWDSPDTLGREWKDYRFGAGRRDAGLAAPATSFVTDDKGAATLHLALAPPEDGAALHDAIITLRGDPSSGVAMPPPLTLPVKPKEGVIGVKPLAPEARFPENGFARFGVVALDADGHRRAADDLDYQIYEEGRSFDWYQAEGRWNYKLQQQKRRIGGDTLALGADGDDVIEWPVAAGIYRLEITDAMGAVRAATDFSAGPVIPDGSPALAPLALSSPASSWQPDRKIEAHFALEKPAMVTALIGDDHIRKVMYGPMQAGDNVVSFTPAKDWHGPVSLEVQTESPAMAGRLVFADAGSPAPSAKSETAASADPLALDASLPLLLHEGDTAQIAFEIANTTATLQTVHYAVSAANLRLDAASGSLAIPAMESRRIALTATALRPGATVKLDVTGAPHLHASHEWAIPVAADRPALSAGVRQRIEPQQSTSWPPAGKARAKEESLLFLSSASLYGAPALLANLLAAEPFTTNELAAALEALRLWREPVIAAGLVPEAAFDRRQKDLALRLIARQRPDGGFAALPGNASGNDENFAMTSRALAALAHSDLAPAKPAADRAADWLKQRLANTWFDESERPARAAAYAALADAGRLDNASLHYFSDTSAKTTLPPEAALDLAFAFAQIGDQPASSFWIDTSGVKKDTSSLPASLLPILAGNAFFDAAALQPSMDAFSARDAKAGIGPAADFLRAVWLIQNRKGPWRVTIGTDKRNPKDVLVLPVAAKAVPPTVHNTGDGPIFLFGAQRVEGKPPSGAARHIYRLNGTEMDAAHPLARGEIYLVVLEGPWAGADSLLVHDGLEAGLRVTGCLPPPPIEADDQLAWLKSQVLTSTLSCESGADGIAMLLARKENAPSWRVAYMAKAEEAGAFALPSAAAYAAGGEGTGMTPLLKTPAQRAEIR